MAGGDWGRSVNLTSTSLGTDGETECNNKEQKTENHDKTGRSSAFPALPHSDRFFSLPAELQRIQSTKNTVEDARAPADQRWGADDYSMTQYKKTTFGTSYNMFRRDIKKKKKKKKNPWLNKKAEKKIEAWCRGAGYWCCNRRLYVELICAEKEADKRRIPLSTIEQENKKEDQIL